MGVFGRHVWLIGCEKLKACLVDVGSSDLAFCLFCFGGDGVKPFHTFPIVATMQDLFNVFQFVGDLREFSLAIVHWEWRVFIWSYVEAWSFARHPPRWKRSSQKCFQNSGWLKNRCTMVSFELRPHINVEYRIRDKRSQYHHANPKIHLASWQGHLGASSIVSNKPEIQLPPVAKGDSMQKMPQSIDKFQILPAKRYIICNMEPRCAMY